MILLKVKVKNDFVFTFVLRKKVGEDDQKSSNLYLKII